MPSFIDDFLDMMADEIGVTPGSTNEYGDFTPSGAEVVYRCYIEGSNRLVRDIHGQEVVASHLAVVGARDPGLTVESHRYRLPARYSPNTDLVAINIEIANDEDGACYQTVVLP